MPVAPARKAGTWKMAYADFLTALMAFFLIMWLVSGVSPEDRAEIADYFHSKTTPAVAITTAAPDSPAGQLFTTLSQQPGLADAGDNVVLTTEADGVRIDLVDSAQRPLFDTGSGALTAAGRDLVALTSQALAPFDAPVSIEGHTDAFTGAGTYSNWDLSAERASEARRALTQAGLAASRIRAVSGLSDTQPLYPGQPHLSANRRISILVHTDG
ncbi:flagellar motor protein MotB [Hyphomonas johnsonii]|nr:flagellar motor protein MotB [Hyphomonas johnsonii]